MHTTLSTASTATSQPSLRPPSGCMFGSVVSPTQSWVFVPIIRESLRLAGHNLQQSAAEQLNAQSVRTHIGGQLLYGT